MSDYRRWFIPGGTYFFTVVAEARRPILATENGRHFLRTAIAKVRETFSFEIIATVLLPDHWHLVMQLPPGDSDYSIRMKRIRSEFTSQWLAMGLPEAPISEPRKSKGERGIWQPRFWEHTVQDEDDLERCCDYIHWNPVKHGHVTEVRDWPWSSFHRFVEQGQYEPHWGRSDPEANTHHRDWGE